MKMMKTVLKMNDIQDSKSWRSAMKLVSDIEGIDGLEIDKEKKTLTVVGNADIVKVVCKLRKLTRAEMVMAGPNKVEEKTKAVKDEGKVEMEERLRGAGAPPYWYNNGYYYYPYYWPSY